MSNIICNRCQHPITWTQRAVEGIWRDGDGQHVECPEQTMELQLLVIDLGDSCVVKVEKGDLDNAITIGDYRMMQRQNSVHVISTPFPELRQAIEGEKPVPRIEKDEHGRYDLSFGTLQHRSSSPIS